MINIHIILNKINKINNNISTFFFILFYLYIQFILIEKKNNKIK